MDPPRWASIASNCKVFGVVSVLRTDQPLIEQPLQFFTAPARIVPRQAYTVRILLCVSISDVASRRCSLLFAADKVIGAKEFHTG